ncbi:gas vesicle protein [Actinomycetospora sp. NBRC 106375]|uniref:GvpL/GvpF family gas vesicle protein n=1 Tax=Actinomycetospora sp. NBRC 106375 TaxID=3032207 RepID=UPI0024A1455E|nr:GvpL/GvpF family gas vesicle protein [Actinomycetospora sp. NBRC 106375]GLZ46557.1 gas vesicle protein [Actinomycetospora sp. NBRC 106375]
MSDTLTYVYAIARDVDPAAVAALQGVGGGAVRTLDAGGVLAVVSDVDRGEFEERALEERLEDLEWLAATARAHHHVVDTLGHDHLVAPLALATVYFDDDRVRAVLDEGRATFAAVLDQLSGRAEWGVKVYGRPGGAAAAATQEKPGSGAEYLRRRRQALRETDTALDDARDAAAEVDAAVTTLAAASRSHRLQDATLSGESDPMVLNRAYLVPIDRAADLREVVASLEGHPRIRVELTGPWVPYSFAQAPEGAAP